MKPEVGKCSEVFPFLLSIISLHINQLGKRGENLQHILNYNNKTLWTPPKHQSYCKKLD